MLMHVWLSNLYYYWLSRHCGILTLFYRAIFNGLRASNENSGPKVTFEPAKLGFKWKRPACLFQIICFPHKCYNFYLQRRFTWLLFTIWLTLTVTLKMAILSWRISGKIHKTNLKFRRDIDGIRTWVAKR